MPHFTVDQLKQAATHLHQEADRLRRSNPEVSARTYQSATALKKLAEHREKNSPQTYQNPRC